MAAVAGQQQPKTPSRTPKKATEAPQQAQQQVDDTASEAQSQADVESTAGDVESTADDAEEQAEDATESAQQQKAQQQPQEGQQPQQGQSEGQGETSAEDEEEEKQRKQDAELADKICGLVSTCLDKVKPTLELITEALDKADRDKQNDKLDEEKLVDHVKPMIQQATDTLKECQSGIKALDPDGKLAKRAQSKAAERKATPEEYRLSDLLKELTESVEKTIKESKRRIQDMPKAKKDLAPMFDVLRDPLLQIISAVGLLLNGVLGLLSGLLGQIGLGGIVDQIANGLGLNKVISLVQHYIGGK